MSSGEHCGTAMGQPHSGTSDRSRRASSASRRKKPSQQGGGSPQGKLLTLSRHRQGGGRAPTRKRHPSERCLENTRSRISPNHWPRASFPAIPICQSSRSIRTTSRRSSTISNRFRTQPSVPANSRENSRSSFEWSEAIGVRLSTGGLLAFLTSSQMRRVSTSCYYTSDRNPPSPATPLDKGPAFMPHKGLLTAQLGAEGMRLNAGGIFNARRLDSLLGGPLMKPRTRAPLLECCTVIAFSCIRDLQAR